MAEKTLEERLSELYEKIDHRDQFFDKDLKTLIDGIHDAREHGGSSDYTELDNKPAINGVQLSGDKTPAQLGLATANQVEVVSNKVDKLPSGYYYGKFNSVEDLPEATEKGYAYVASSDPTVFYTYLVSGAGAEWVDSGNKMVNTIDITTPKTEDTKLSQGEKYYASANVNDRPAQVDSETETVVSMGYKVLNPAMSFVEQVTAANTIYEIKDSFDLGGGSVTIPANCTLKFNGGRVVNGTIVGQGTILEGNVKFESVSGSFASEIYSSYSSLECDYDKFAMLLTLSIDKLVIDEDFQLSTYPTSVSSTIKVIDGLNHSITINTDCYNANPLTTTCNSFTNIVFDFTNHSVVGNALNFSAFEILKINNVVVKNIRRMRNVARGTSAIAVSAAQGTVLDITNVTLKNIASIGNGTIGDGLGSIVGLYITPYNNCIINVSDIVVDNIYNFDSNNNVIFEDAGGIYVHYDTPATNQSVTTIKNIVGNNFGKRLIKSDGNNLTISNLIATSTHEDVLCIIGCNDGGADVLKNVAIENVYFTGIIKKMFIAVDMDNVSINDVHYTATAPTTATDTKTLFSVSSDVTINNSSFVCGGIDTITFARTDDDNINATFVNCVFGGDKLCTSIANSVTYINCDFKIGSRLSLKYVQSGEKKGTYVFEKCNFKQTTKVKTALISGALYASYGLIIRNSSFDYTSRYCMQVSVVKDFIFENNVVNLKDNNDTGNVAIGQITKVTTTTPIALECRINGNNITAYKATYYDFQINNNEINAVYIHTQDRIKLSCTNCYSDSSSKFIGSTPISEDGSRGIVAIASVGDVDMTYNGGWDFSKPSAYSLDNATRISSAKTLKVGASVFCTTIGKPIFWGGASWVDANGETVGLQVSDTSVLIGAAQDSSKTINVYSASAITAVSQVIDETSVQYTTGSTADTVESTSYYAGNAISLNEGDIIRIDGTAVILNSSKDAVIAFTSGNSYIASGTETIYLATTIADTTVVYVKGNWLEASVGTVSGSTYPVTLKALSANSTAPRGAKVIITNTDGEVVIINVVQSY